MPLPTLSFEVGLDQMYAYMLILEDSPYISNAPCLLGLSIDRIWQKKTYQLPTNFQMSEAGVEKGDDMQILSAEFF